MRDCNSPLSGQDGQAVEVVDRISQLGSQGILRLIGSGASVSFTMQESFLNMHASHLKAR
jgi:hypothetical protein